MPTITQAKGKLDVKQESHDLTSELTHIENVTTLLVRTKFKIDWSGDIKEILEVFEACHGASAKMNAAVKSRHLKIQKAPKLTILKHALCTSTYVTTPLPLPCPSIPPLTSPASP